MQSLSQGQAQRRRTDGDRTSSVRSGRERFQSISASKVNQFQLEEANNAQEEIALKRAIEIFRNLHRADSLMAGTEQSPYLKCNANLEKFTDNITQSLMEGESKFLNDSKVRRFVTAGDVSESNEFFRNYFRSYANEILKKAFSGVLNCNFKSAITTDSNRPLAKNFVSHIMNHYYNLVWPAFKQCVKQNESVDCT